MAISLKLPKSLSLIDHFQQFLKSDARHYQILFQSLFLIYGITILGWEGDIYKYASVFGTCICTQALFNYFATGRAGTAKSAIISGMGICLMLRTNSAETAMMAAFLSIAGKYIFRINDKHIFNPSNFGICLTVLLSGDAWLTPGQWGSSALLLFFIGALGFSVVLTVKRLDTAISFLFAFCGLHFLRQVVYQGWEEDFFFHTLTSGTLLVFTFFMITDPVSSPSSKFARIVWSAMIGALAFYMQSVWFVTGAPIWALFILSPLTPLLDIAFKAEKFKWKTFNI